MVSSDNIIHVALYGLGRLYLGILCVYMYVYACNNINESRVYKFERE